MHIHTHSQTQRHTDSQTHRHKDAHTYAFRVTDSQIHRQMQRCTHMCTDTQMHRQMHRHTDRRTDAQQGGGSQVFPNRAVLSFLITPLKGETVSNLKKQHRIYMLPSDGRCFKCVFQTTKLDCLGALGTVHLFKKKRVSLG